MRLRELREGYRKADVRGVTFELASALSRVRLSIERRNAIVTKRIFIWSGYVAFILSDLPSIPFRTIAKMTA